MARPKKETPPPAAEAPNFEADLESLEAIVGALEEGGLSLDESLKRFEQGIHLARRCEKSLTEAEKKIEILTRNAQGELAAQPFEDGEEDGPPEPAYLEDAGDDEEEDENSLLF